MYCLFKIFFKILKRKKESSCLWRAGSGVKKGEAGGCCFFVISLVLLLDFES